LTFAVAIFAPSTTTSMLGGTPRHGCPLARIVTLVDAGSCVVVDAVAFARSVSALPPDALESRTAPPALAGATVIDSASTRVGAAAEASGTTDTTMATITLIAPTATEARTGRNGNMG
jgi:hypothetical protein